MATTCTSEKSQAACSTISFSHQILLFGPTCLQSTLNNKVEHHYVACTVHEAFGKCIHTVILQLHYRTDVFTETEMLCLCKILYALGTPAYFHLAYVTFTGIL
jgi:hypothetical protein